MITIKMNLYKIQNSFFQLDLLSMLHRPPPDHLSMIGGSNYLSGGAGHN